MNWKNSVHAKKAGGGVSRLVPSHLHTLYLQESLGLVSW